jgi:serine/threonine-protein kinase
MVFKGKWNGNVYRLERLLGAGSNGQVWLASRGGVPCALKLGLDAADLQGETNILAALERGGRNRTPYLLDADDARLGGQDIPFYAMRYVPGMPVRQFVRRRGPRAVAAAGSHLLDRLAELHEAGWVFGDLKCDNVLVAPGGQVTLVDYGGATRIGRSVRQFTEIYDRGYWRAGNRTAEPAYDWFSAAVLWVHALDGDRLMRLTRTLPPQNRHPRELLRLVHTHPYLRHMEIWMRMALEGRFSDTREATRRWREQAVRLDHAAPDGIPGWMAGMAAATLVLGAATAVLWFVR